MEKDSKNDKIGDNITDTEIKKVLNEWLNNNGYIAYFHEMLFHSGYADAVAWKDNKVFAFEIKQKGDNIAKGLRQLIGYSKGSNFCILVVDEIGPYQIKKFQNKGFGVWKRVGNDFIELHPPKPMAPVQSQLNWSLDKFKRYYKKRIELALSKTKQTKLELY